MGGGHVGPATRGSLVRRAGLALVLASVLSLGHLSQPPAAHAATFTVSSTADSPDAAPGDGICRANTFPPRCTLRAAIEEANALAGSHTITVPAGVYTLPIGELAVTGDVTINGAGQQATIVQAATQPGVATRRVFRLEPFTGKRVSVYRMTVRHGLPTDSQLSNEGGGIITFGDVSLGEVAVVSNSANQGGGIKNAGRLTIRNSVISDNVATQRGGGIRCTVGENTGQDRLILMDTTIARNSAGDEGGGLQANDCNVAATRVAFVGNGAHSQGGGVKLDELGTHIFTNVTISGNRSNIFAGGLQFTGQEPGYGWPQSTLLLDHATIVGNATGRAGVGANLVGFVRERVSIRNSIIAYPVGGARNCSNAFSLNSMALVTTLGGNIEFPGNTCFDTRPPAGTADTIDVDPRLLALALNGGLTQTHALASGSPAIDNSRTATCATSDQRSLPRPRDGNGDGIAHCDSGAFEVQP
jgi:CSLREA domain-containing protein